MPCKTAVVLIVFRRPDLAAAVFERIRQAQPSRLFVIADGPRDAQEAAICAQTRAVTEQVDWPCEVVRDYADGNMGTRRRISLGLDRVFEQVEEAIILEDDCLPHLSFFSYCDELLERYREDERFWCVSGDNFQRGQTRGDGSYYVSNYNHGWGWATWRRAWMHYDHEMSGWPAFRDAGRLAEILDDPVEVKYWHGIFETLYTKGTPNSWAYIWTLTCWMHGGLSLLPNVNLVANTGFGAEATNTTGKENWISARRAEDIGPLVHPSSLARNVEADQYTFDHVYPGRRMRMEQCWKFRMRRRLWRIKQRLLGQPVVK
jgi:hypothetical protein